MTIKDGCLDPHSRTGRVQEEAHAKGGAAGPRDAGVIQADQSRYLEAFFRHALTPLALLDREFNFIRVNEAYAKSDQRRVDEFPGRNHFELYPSDAREIFEEVVRTREPRQVAARPFVYADHPERGITFWDWTLTPLLDGDGEVEVLVFALEDVTARKRAEETLQAERERFNGILEMLPAYLVLLTPDYRVVFANRFFRERFGESRGRRCFEYLFGRGEPCEACETYTVLKTLAPHEWEWIDPDGRNYQIFDFPFTDTDGSDLILEMGIDISQQKLAETALREMNSALEGKVEERTAELARANANLRAEIEERRKAEEALRDAHERTAWLARFPEENPSPILRVSADGNVLYHNPAAASWPEWTCEIGLPLPAPLSALVEGAMTRGCEAQQDIQLGEKFFSVWVAPFPRYRYANVYGRDITEHKRAEGDLQISREELMAANEELTVLNRELEAKTVELNAAYQDLRETDRHKNQFLAVLSHELRNPLMTIGNSLAILDRTAPGGEQAKRAKAVINRQFGQLSHLVDDLLDLTRITQNKIRLRRKRLELNETVRRTAEDQKPFFDLNGVSLRVEPASAPIFVHADEARLVQAIGNLLQNAAKFTPRGGSTSISIDSAGSSAGIRIADTGVGIPPEMLPRLFQPFMQADTALDRSRGGLGLGLALVKGIIELHGGEVGVFSAGIEQGAEFTIHLPIEADPYEESRTVPPGIRHRARRVLLIEDNKDLAESMRDLLELDGHEIRVAGSGPEGLAEARRFRPEILLCDIGLPGMDGYAIARAFRADDRLTEVLLIALTGYAQPEDLERVMEAGFDRHLAKPVELETLERLLGEGGGNCHG